MSLAGQEYRILVPLADVKAASDLLRLAAAITVVTNEQVGGKVIALGIVEVPEEMGFVAGTEPVRVRRELLRRLNRLEKWPDLEVRTLVRVSRQVWQGIVQTAEEERADLILFGWKGWTESPNAIFGTTIDEVVRNPPCDIAVVRLGNLDRCRRILLPVRGGPHAALALKLAEGLAQHTNGCITALHVEPPEIGAQEREEQRQEFRSVLASGRFPDRIREVVRESQSVADGVLREVPNHDMIVMGAAAGQPGTPFLFGPIAETVAQATECPMIVVKTRTPGDMGFLEWRRLFGSQPGARDISEVVDKWFVENTFYSREFEDLAELVRLKERRGLTISLGLPALNEEETIGNVIRVIKQELMERYRLLDEMVLIDSRSTDRTREIAASLGVPVYIHQEVLPEMGSFVGKGEALWKSLHVLKGDIIAWVDTDIKNIHPRFVYGLIGPLLKDQRIKYVKGFYKRPVQVGSVRMSAGGGRVTELVARPLLNLFYPQLSGVIQPLAGEYAGRREVLEGLPFFTGYGVEIGLLIDILESHGLQAIGQVDLKRRVHRNQQLSSLSKMAFTIVQVVVRRLEQRHRLQLLSQVNKSMKLIQHSARGFHIEVKELEDAERPPMITVPQYRQWRALGEMKV